MLSRGRCLLFCSVALLFDVPLLWSFAIARTKCFSSFNYCAYSCEVEGGLLFVLVGRLCCLGCGGYESISTRKTYGGDVGAHRGYVPEHLYAE